MAERRTPRYALLDNHTPPVRVLGYEGNGYFTVLRWDDAKVFVPRHRLTFTNQEGGNEHGEG